MNQHREEAVKLRSAGYSYAMIEQKLGIAKSTLSNWFHDQAFKPNKEVLKRIQYGPIKSATISHNRRVEETEQLRLRGINEIGELSQRDLWLLGIGLYIGEGSKVGGQIQFVNSDPGVIRAILRWFKESCDLSVENITIGLHVYPDTDEASAINFWMKATGLPRGNFRKTQIDKRLNKSKIKSNSLPYGTASLRVRSNGDLEKGVRLFRRIKGWMDGALSV